MSTVEIFTERIPRGGCFPLATVYGIFDISRILRHHPVKPETDARKLKFKLITHINDDEFTLKKDAADAKLGEENMGVGETPVEL